MTFSLEKLPQNLKAIRKLHGLTQQDVANVLKISPHAISHYENHKRSIPLSTLSEMMELYGFSIEFKIVEK